ncbi:unnamed protein product, partial [Amoebophrya sp. A120]
SPSPPGRRHQQNPRPGARLQDGTASGEQGKAGGQWRAARYLGASLEKKTDRRRRFRKKDDPRNRARLGAFADADRRNVCRRRLRNGGARGLVAVPFEGAGPLRCFLVGGPSGLQAPVGPGRGGFTAPPGLFRGPRPSRLGFVVAGEEGPGPSLGRIFGARRARRICPSARARPLWGVCPTSRAPVRGPLLGNLRAAGRLRFRMLPAVYHVRPSD